KADLASPEMRKLKPIGNAPILEADDCVLYENASILHYLSQKHPETGLGGDGTLGGNAEVNRWLAIINSDVHPSYKPLFGTTSYLEDDTAIKKTQEHAREQLREYFELFNQQLDNRDWLAGARSIADPY